MRKGKKKEVYYRKREYWNFKRYAIFSSYEKFIKNWFEKNHN